MAPTKPNQNQRNTAAGQRCFAFNGGFFTQKRLRQILNLKDMTPRLGLPKPSDSILIWGQSPTAHRGEAIAAKTGAKIIRVEDAFLRSVQPGRKGDPPLGLLIDHSGCHFDHSRPSDLETILSRHPLSDRRLMARARDGRQRMADNHITKYTGFAIDTPAPPQGYVLVIDQTRGDASIGFSGASAQTFADMLTAAKTDHPNTRIVIKTHPETQQGLRAGHFGPKDADDRTVLWTAPTAPTRLFAGASAVYVVSSQMGAEAIWTGHKPVVFGAPFYAGWGLSDDRGPALPRRGRTLNPDQLFAAAMILYPTWYDPNRDELCDFETALTFFEAQTRAWREDHKGWDCHGMRLWKRRPLQQFFGQFKKLRFDPATPKRNAMIWGVKDGPEGAARLEDGFLRSRGLGANLVPPLSLILDRQGLYFDPHAPSDMETAIAKRETLTDGQQKRAKAMRQAITSARLSKYNLNSKPHAPLPKGHRILVPGQVEDDASILRGAVGIARNLDLLRHTRAQNPDAVIIYKPHPDVEAGLRNGRVDDPLQYADVVADNADPLDLLDQVEEVWTMTSLLGFEALLRGVKVTCLGQPFYSGWGLTDDAHPVDRRIARPTLDGLVHAALIDVPRYFDPVSGLPCSAEVAVHRLSTGQGMKAGPVNRSLAKLQGVFASYANWWR